MLGQGTTAAPSNPSCDRCRTRKVKCVPIPEDELPAARAKSVADRCKGCYRAGTVCTHDYIHKKPGRPLGSSGGSSRSKRGVSASASASAPNTAVRSTTPRDSAQAVGNVETALLSPTLGSQLLGLDPTALGDGCGPTTGSIFGSARNALYPTYAYQPTPLFEPDLALGLADVLGQASASGTQLHPGVPQPATGADLWRGVHTVPAPLGSTPTDHPSVPSLDMPVEYDKAYEQGLDMDKVLPWADVCFFLSLFLKDQHCLVPVVHKPTFSQDVLNRRDRRDEAFRGLLCSIVAYTICQNPISTMTQAYERPRLVTMLHRCSKAADTIRHRQRMTPSLVLLASTILDWITAQAVGNPQVCDIHAAEATRLAHALGLSDANPRNGARMNTIEQQICRRLYWIIYSKDKTDAMSGRPIILHDFEGVAPFPLEVDDDYITTVGYLPQPERKTSYMYGFVTIMRIFQIISQAITKHRSFANVADAGTEEDVDLLVRWIENAQRKLHVILDGLPPSLCTDLNDLSNEEIEPAADINLFGIQQANITITVLCAEFVLLDLRASIRPHEDTRAEREEMARKAYDGLSSIPYEYLASNGESMRGKVLRIILALLSMTPEPINFSQNVWDWWNMYSRVQFLQVIPDETMLIIDQQQNSAHKPSPHLSV